MQNVDVLINLWWFFPLSILVTLIILKKMPVTLRKYLIVTLIAISVLLEAIIVYIFLQSSFILFLLMSFSYFIKLFILKEIMQGIWKNSFEDLVKENLRKYLEISVVVPPVFLGTLILFKLLPRFAEKR